MTAPASEIHIVDNDFLIKLARWDLLGDFIAVVNTTPRNVRVIHSLRARTKLPTGQPNLRLMGTAVAARRAHDFLTYAGPPRPIDSAFLAEYANKIQNLDEGELILVSALIAGGGDYFYTGDKRAIKALSHFVGTSYDDRLRGRIICLEQVLYRIITENGIGNIRANIASDLTADPGVADKLVGGAQTPEDTFKTGLRSRIEEIHASSGGLLHPYPSNDASTVPQAKVA